MTHLLIILLACLLFLLLGLAESRTIQIECRRSKNPKLIKRDIVESLLTANNTRVLLSFLGDVNFGKQPFLGTL